MQDVRDGVKACKVYHAVIRELAVQLRKQTPAPDTIAARLLSVKVRL